MPRPATDPYKTLGVSPRISDAELRAAYRRLVQIHHPDHNGGSAESARRFEDIQDAYARVRELRASGSAAGPQAARRGSASARSGSASTGSRGAARPRPAGPPPRVDVDPGVESRLKDLERELREARAASERARRAAQEAAREAAGAGAVMKNKDRPSDEELGYVTTDDSFGKILADAGSEIVDRLSRVGERISGASDQVREPVAKRVSDLVDELEQLTSKLTGDSKGAPK